MQKCPQVCCRVSEENKEFLENNFKSKSLGGEIILAYALQKIKKQVKGVNIELENMLKASFTNSVLHYQDISPKYIMMKVSDNNYNGIEEKELKKLSNFLARLSDLQLLSYLLSLGIDIR